MELDRREREIFECPICLNPEAEINGSYTLDCQHRTCAVCIPALVISKINSNEVSEDLLVCPYENCRCTILENTVKELCPHNIYQKFLTFRTEKYLFERSISGTMKKCPSPNCNYHFEIDSNDRDSAGVLNAINFECPECFQAYCFYCRANNNQIGPGINTTIILQ